MCINFHFQCEYLCVLIQIVSWRKYCTEMKMFIFFKSLMLRKLIDLLCTKNDWLLAKNSYSRVYV